MTHGRGSLGNLNKGDGLCEEEASRSTERRSKVSL